MQPTKDQIEKWHKDPNNWKRGSIYYNPEDSRTWVDKRIKWMGWTINFGNKKGVTTFLILIFATILWMCFLITHIH
jgi:uncharacterized membrane protein